MRCTGPDTAAVVTKASDALFGQPLVTNVVRGHLVEAIVSLALEPDWKWCASDYASWDFENQEGLRLEIKQSALRQTWAKPAHGKVRTSFDIKPRAGRWEGTDFIKELGRSADIYVFAFHPIADESADHRCPQQWRFFAVATDDLPGTQRISLKQVEERAQGVSFFQLCDEVQRLVVRL